MQEDFSLEDFEDTEYLLHYGVARRSGRYPWGSGDNPHQHVAGDFLSRIEDLKKQNITFTDEDGHTYTGETAIAKYMKMTVRDFRAAKGVAKQERRAADVARVKSLMADGKSKTEIAKIMGLAGESTVRSLLKAESEERMNKSVKTSEFLKDMIDKKGIIDVGAGVEQELGLSKEKMEQAISILEGEGYEVYTVGLPQVTNPGQQTPLRLVCPPGTEYKDAYKARDENKINSVIEYHSSDGGLTFDAPKPPQNLDSSRIKINYKEDGGEQKDGLIELRRGVPDLSMGNSHYAQVRIGVDGTHYLKGMAMYSDDIPEGYDVVFNTNKSNTTPMNKVLKSIKDNNPNNPFGALIQKGGQTEYTGEDGKKHLSVVNKVHSEGDWAEYNKGLSAQFLAKQPIKLIKQQLNLDYADKMSEFDEIKSLTNPTVKRYFLDKFANSCDSAAVHLKGASLPRQAYQVILPVPSMKDTEVYAPSFKQGEEVALIRYPHGGVFEIPVLKVNNKQTDAKKSIGDAKDAVGINKHIADQLSGADWDGDDVLVIPTKGIKIDHSPRLKELKDFDPKDAYSTIEIDTGKKDKKGKEIYKYTDASGNPVKIMSEAYKQKQMGIVSNLITDMTLKGASTEEIAKAVKHSMVVIDAVKHKLNYKQSEADNDIATLKNRWQGHYNENGNWSTGASTLISRSKSPVSVNKKHGSKLIDPDTGETYYKSDEVEEYTSYKRDKNGNVVLDSNGKPIGEKKIRTQDEKKMATVKDARELSSGTVQEEAYAEYANKTKALANTSRKELMSTGNLHYSRSARDTYSEEVASLNTKLKTALLNAPRERMAQLIANNAAKARIKSNPDVYEDKKEQKKVKQQEIEIARAKVGSSSKSRKIEITDKEWEAIQAGAVSDHILSQILNNTDIDKLRERATPRQTNALSDAKQNRMKAMKASGYTISQIAEEMNVSTSTVSKYL